MSLIRGKYGSNDAVVLLKYALIILLIILLPITLFLTAFSWYGSLQVHAIDDSAVATSLLFLKNSLIFGTIGLMSSLLYFFIFLLIRFSLNRVVYRWKKMILIFSILGATIIFLLFEIFSIVFMNYYYSWQLSLVLIFWPLVFVVLSVLLLVDYFNFYNEQKTLNISKNHRNQQEKDLIFRDQTGTFQ